MKVMIVDDDATELKLARQVIAALGHEVVTRSESLGTVSEVRRHRPEVVILDVGMPGLRGDALAELLNRPQPDGYRPTVAFLSGATDDELEQATSRTGVRRAIQKGTPARLRDQLRILLKEIELERSSA